MTESHKWLVQCPPPTSSLFRRNSDLLEKLEISQNEKQREQPDIFVFFRIMKKTYFVFFSLPSKLGQGGQGGNKKLLWGNGSIGLGKKEWDD